MIRFEISTETTAPFTLVVIGEHLKILKNPRLTAYMPFWLQQDLANSILRQTDRPTRKKVARELAHVIEIDALRQHREERVHGNIRLGG